MDVAIGMPLVMKSLPGDLFTAWARAAEEAGFSSVSTLGRIVFDSHEELMVLAAAAAVTSRIKLATSVLIAPPREPTMLARQALTLDSISGGRFTLGLGTGWRDEDYLATGADWSRRGALLEEQIIRIRSIWSGSLIPVSPDRSQSSAGGGLDWMARHDGPVVGPIGPRAVRPGGPELLLGASEQAGLRRVGRYADAYMTGPLPARVPDGHVPHTVVSQAADVRRFAEEAGRPMPRLIHATYVALEVDDDAASRRLKDYYAVGGADRWEWPFSRALRSADAVRRHLDEMESVGVDECYLWPTVPELGQIELIAAAAFGR